MAGRSVGGGGRPSSPVVSSSTSYMPAGGFDSPVTTKMRNQHPAKLSSFPRLPGSSSPYGSPVPLKPTSTLQGAPRTMPLPPLSPAGSSAFLQNHELNQDPNFAKLVKEELNKTMERERERASALVARETENYTTVDEYKHALARERRYSATLSLELTHYKFLTKYTSCNVHTAAEINEEARINSIIRNVDNMKHSLEKEKARAVMEVECEEEKIVNRLMERLQEVTKEKRLLEEKLQGVRQVAADDLVGSALDDPPAEITVNNQNEDLRDEEQDELVEEEGGEEEEDTDDEDQDILDDKCHDPEAEAELANLLQMKEGG
ncbi:hypothetical protein THAOC_31801 [Thalassiosira oceanica]|uniref:Uncharacterized protein n=1 Tax=Thalassiosira oceanica TaxID=159749 RepID=K0R8I1_THAOC|nr:hypothetical protein THAOC_31801 [Thalassiosira oceanica]|eukprot:EJK49335.1 hypothetical protein THAOC_31801 [Thalassiosira oceanica]